MLRGSERGGVKEMGLLVVWVVSGETGTCFWVEGLKASIQKMGWGEEGNFLGFG